MINEETKNEERVKEKQTAFADSYITANASNFSPDQIYLIKDKLAHLPVERQTAVQSVPLKSPTLTLILSLFFGMIGVDRFYLGHIGLGIGKIITFGGFGFWAIIDWFLIMKATKKVNYQKMMTVI